MNPSILRIFYGGLLINLVNAAFFLIFNIFLAKQGYPDSDIAGIVSMRYLGVLLAAVPMGIWIKGRPLKGFFLTSAIALPLISVAMILAVQAEHRFLMHLLMLLWGAVYVVSKVCAIPFILRHTRRRLQPEAISLNYSTWSLSMFLGGLLIVAIDAASLTATWRNALGSWAEGEILLLFSVLGAFALLPYLKIRETHIPERASSAGKTLVNRLSGDYDWWKIARALFPTTVLAVGAGLTIPFINLFFYQVFGVDSEDFSLLGAFTALLVFGGVITVPFVQKRFGYHISITLSQSIAVLLLVGLALTELFAHYAFAFYLALFFYLGRQPLMNIAAPMTNDLIMQYVGPKNHEIVASLISSIWSGGWFISGILFKQMRNAQLPYYQIFLLTAAMYGIGVIAYNFLIRASAGQEAARKAESEAAETLLRRRMDQPGQPAADKGQELTGVKQS